MMWQREEATTKARRRRRRRSSAGGAFAASAFNSLALCCLALSPRLPVAEGGLLRHTVGKVVHSEPITAVSQGSTQEAGWRSVDGKDLDREAETGPRQQSSSFAAPLPPEEPVTVTYGPVRLVLTGISPARLPDDDDWGHINGEVVRVLNDALTGEGLDTLSATPMGEYLPAVGGQYDEFTEVQLDLTFSASYSLPSTVDYGSEVRGVLADEGKMNNLKGRLRDVGDAYFASLTGVRMLPPDTELGAPLAGQRRSFVPPPRVDNETPKADAWRTEMHPLPASSGGGTSMTDARPVEVDAPMDAANGGRPVELPAIAPASTVEDQLRPVESAPAQALAPDVDGATGGFSLVQSHSSANDVAAGMSIAGGVRPEDLFEGSKRPGSGVSMPLPTRNTPIEEGDDRADTSRTSRAPRSNTGFDSSAMVSSTRGDVVQTSKGLLLGPNYVESAITPDRAMAIRTTAAVMMLVLIASVAVVKAAIITKERMAQRKYISRKKRIHRAKEAYQSPWKRGPNSDGMSKKMGSGVMK
mmetsp:Transcript_10522/g.30998  ORF Transcript_10522/g.30998 Transcript_10522/m.30998 type:complete len:527 (-) Transcript_10522:152-1732(-)